MGWLLFSHFCHTLSSYSPKHGRKLEILQMRKRSISFLTDTVKEVWRHNQDMGEVIVKQEKTFRETWPYQTIGKHSLSVCMNIARLIAYYIDYIVEQSALYLKRSVSLFISRGTEVIFLLLTDASCEEIGLQINHEKVNTKITFHAAYTNKKCSDYMAV